MVAGKRGHDQGNKHGDGIRRAYADPLADWAKIRNAWARDTRLDWDALGLLTWLSTHADGFGVATVDLYAMRAAGRHAVDGMIEELERFGYLRRETHRERGRFVSTTWHLLDPTDSEQVG